MKIWVTNFPRSVRGFWPRRRGVNYFEGPPKKVPLLAEHHVGIYTDDPDHRDKPLIKSPSEQ